jgi:ParB family chromosome partitioning protein
MGHARALLGFSSPGDQLRLAERIVREGLSVRRVEELVGQETRRTEPRVRSRPEKPPHIAALETTLEAALGTRVRVELARGRQDRGKLTIEFFSEEDFQKLLALLAPQRPDLP